MGVVWKLIGCGCCVEGEKVWKVDEVGVMWEADVVM